MKYVLLVVLALMIGTLVFVLGLFGTDEKGIVVSTPIVESESVDVVEGSEQVAEEARYVAMQSEYKKLEKARRNLDRRLARIKAVMWGVGLPRARSKEIVGNMRKGYELLNSKKLLGAFSGLQAMSEELARVEYVYQKLEGIVEEIRAAKAEA